LPACHPFITLFKSEAVQTTVIITAIGILAIIACEDARTRRIPNYLSIAIAILGFARMMIVGDYIGAIHTVAVTSVVLTAGLLLFWRGIVGGGDAKLVAAMVLLVGYPNLIGFLFLMSLCGGALSLAILAQDKLQRGSVCPLSPGRTSVEPQAAASKAVAARTTVPYGVAIAAGGVITFVLEFSSVK
jgi:prepilin peptidase CpaA